MENKTFIRFKERAQSKYGDKFDYSQADYVNASTPIKIICPEHGEFMQTTTNHMRTKCGCPKCGFKTYGESKKYTTEVFIQKAKSIHGNKYDYSLVNYNDYNTKVKIFCIKHQQSFKQLPTDHLSGKGCPLCGKERIAESKRSNTSEFIEKAKKIHKNTYDYSKVDYHSDSEPVVIICKKHGEFQQTPNNHLSGKGCPKCQLKSQAKLYNKLAESFPDIEIVFETKPNSISWLGEQRFDIYFPKYNIAVEYNGIQHYIPVKHFGGEIKFNEQQSQDKLKRKKCSKNGCALFEVPYNYVEKDYEILVDNIKEIITNKDNTN